MRFIYTKNFKRFFAAFVLVCLLIMADRLGYLNLLKTGVLNGFGATSSAAGKSLSNVRDFFAVIGTLANLSKDNAKLNQTINELSFENARLQSAKAENSALRRALDYAETAPYQMIAAEVSLMDPTGFTQTVVINKGSNSNISLGQSVVVTPGLLVGRITRVYSSSSEVTLITDPSITINSEVSESAARGLVKGVHGISLELDLVTQNEVIKNGDRIITSGLAGDYPRGLLVGEISGIKTGASDLFQQAAVTPLADLRNLKFVFVVQ